MTREEDVDREILKGFYFAYKDGTSPPGSVRDLKDIKVTGDEFVASERRLMQAKLLDGTKEHVTSGGTVYFPSEISDSGIEFYENHNVEPFLRGIQSVDPGFNGKKYRLQKWVSKNPKWIIGTIVVPTMLFIAGIIVLQF